MKVDVLLGLQWGDEGKGKIVDVLTPQYDIIARFQGGPNAGHTIEFGNKKFILHTIPSGIFYKDKTNLIGNGVIIDPYILQQEIRNLEQNSIDVRDSLMVSRRANLILPTHRLLDATYETAKGKEKIGSTLKGIGPAYTDKIGRNGIRVGDLESSGFDERYSKLRETHLQIIKYYNFRYFDHLIDGIPFPDYEARWLEAARQILSLKLVDAEYFLNESLEKGMKVLAEGAQGTMLDIDFGSYPFVTSSNTMIGGVCTGLGVAPRHIGKVMGVFKAYCTRVGSGPFPTELPGKEGDLIRQAGHEYGSTTGRPRRCGWLDLAALQYSVMLNGVSCLYMMKTDVLDSFDTLCTSQAYKYNGKIVHQVPFDYCSGNFEPVYESLKGWNQPLDHLRERKDMPAELAGYIKHIENYVKIPVSIISYGPDREHTLFR
jgi:adenylosuccinate synthase